MHDVDDIVQVISERLGRDVSMYDETFLRKSVETRRGKTSCASTGDYLAHLSGNEEEAEAFFRSLTITYSKFFRNTLTYSYLEQAVLPRLVEKRAQEGRFELRIWSAGCAAGQEAYSAAILLDDLAEKRGSEIPFKIFATDSSVQDLDAGRNGLYQVGAVENIPLKYVNKYFSKHDGVYAIAPRLRERIDFSFYDILDKGSWCPPASIFGDFDLVMCCNLLFYYRKDMRHFILGKVSRCLRSDGYLVTGGAERPMLEQADDFQSLVLPAAVFQKTKRRNRS